MRQSPLEGAASLFCFKKVTGEFVESGFQYTIVKKGGAHMMPEADIDIIARVLVCAMGVSAACLIMSAIREYRFAAILFAVAGCVFAVFLGFVIILSKQ